MKRILLFVILLFVQKGYAQNAVRFEHINVEDGLSQSSVNYIFQDSHGFMWFATGDGLNRYDGSGFIVYKSSFNDTFSSHLKGRDINSLVLEDKNNKLWLGTDEGISYLDYRHEKSGDIRNKQGTLLYGAPVATDSDVAWFIASQTGMYAVHVDNMKYDFYPFTDKWQTDRQTVNTIKNSVAAPNGIWIADKTGLLFFNKSTHKDERIIVNDKFNSVYCLQNGNLLLTSNEGIYLYDPNNKNTRFVSIENKNNHAQWRSCVADTFTHTVYLGASNNGMICKLNLDNATYEFLSIQNQNINCLFIDRSRNLWVGTEGSGIYKLNLKQQKFFCFKPTFQTRSTDGKELMAKSIYRDDSGRIWTGTYDNGLAIYDPLTGMQEKVRFPVSTEDKLIGVILRDSCGNVVVTIGSDVFWLDPKTQKVLNQTTLPTIRSSSSHPIIYALAEWRKGHFLAGTNEGLFSVTNERGHAYPGIFKTLSSNEFLYTWTYCLYKSSDIIYTGMRNGVYAIRMLNDTPSLITTNIFPNVSIRHFYKSTHTPLLWIATEKGLVAYNEITKRYNVYDETSGLANSSVYAILPQNDSSLWISNNHGISNLEVHYKKGMDIKVRFTNYSVKDGLQSNEFNTGAYYYCKDGTLIFGGINGINWFRPAEIKYNAYAATPSIAELLINDSMFAADTAIYIHRLVLPYNRNTISLSFRALEFTQPDQNKFAYKMDGLDKDWVYTTNDKVRYSNLRPGTYDFLLKASNNDGIWNDTPLAIHIVIKPPYWQTWWFRSLIIAIAAGIIYLLARTYVRQKITAKTRELEKQQALYLERLRISKDVHDDLGSGLSKISLMAAIAQKKAIGNDVLGNDIKHISSVSKELVDNIRDLVWVLNPENTSLEQLVSRLREYCADYLENMPMNMLLDFPENVPEMRISREAQRNIFLTVKEAVNNCVKHAAASEIRISLIIDNSKMNITISDNGKSFDMANIKSNGNGLRNMKQRIETIGGTFAIQPSFGVSTIIQIIILLDNLYAEKNTTLV